MNRPKAFKNQKGHLLIHISMPDVVEMFGGFGICDSCNESDVEGYLIPALGEKWYCRKCYKEWKERAIYYEADREYEETVFSKLLNITGATWTDTNNLKSTK